MVSFATMGCLMRKIVSYFQDESGAAAAEYALILAIIGAGIATAAVTLGKDIASAMNSAGSAIASYTY